MRGERGRGQGAEIGDEGTGAGGQGTKGMTGGGGGKGRQRMTEKGQGARGKVRRQGEEEAGERTE